MDFKGFDHEIFQNSVEESFKEPITILASSNETMFVGGKLATIKSRLLKASTYLDELAKKVEPLTLEGLRSSDPSKLDAYLETILQDTKVHLDLFD